MYLSQCGGRWIMETVIVTWALLNVAFVLFLVAAARQDQTSD